MKKLILMSILMSVPSLVNAQDVLSKMEEKKQNLIDFMMATRSKTIHQPAEMVEKWLNWKAEKLRTGIMETMKMKDQIQDPEIREAWSNIIKTKLKLLFQLETLPVPAEGFKKSLAGKARWLKIESKKMALTAEQLRLIADQTGVKVAAVLADMKERKANLLMDVYRAVMAGKMVGAAMMAKSLGERLGQMSEPMAKSDDTDDEEMFEESSSMEID